MPQVAYLALRRPLKATGMPKIRTLSFQLKTGRADIQHSRDLLSAASLALWRPLEHNWGSAPITFQGFSVPKLTDLIIHRFHAKAYLYAGCSYTKMFYVSSEGSTPIWYYEISKILASFKATLTYKWLGFLLQDVQIKTGKRVVPCFHEFWKR